MPTNDPSSPDWDSGGDSNAADYGSGWDMGYDSGFSSYFSPYETGGTYDFNQNTPDWASATDVNDTRGRGRGSNMPGTMGNGGYWNGSVEGLFGDLYGNQGVNPYDAGDLAGAPGGFGTMNFNNISNMADPSSTAKSEVGLDDLEKQHQSSGENSLGDYSLSSADNRTALNAADADYRATPAPEPGLLEKYRDSVAPLQGFLKNPIVSALMSLNPVTAALKTVLGGPNTVGGYLGSLFSNNPIGKALGAFGGSQMANYATEGEFAPVSSGQIGGTLGSLFGSATGSPYGSLAGSYLGSRIGDQSGSTGGDYGNTLSTSLNSGLGGLALAGLGGLYASNKLGSQISDLQGLYGQNSSYAQALREQLNRRDAAAGRRSQYGPREVELQAALAGNASKLAPMISQLNNQRLGTQGAAIAAILQNLSKNPNLLKNTWNGLSSIFTSPSSNDTWQGIENGDNSGFEFTGGGA